MDDPTPPLLSRYQEEEQRLCASLAAAMAEAKGDKLAEAAIWDEHWKDVYALAEATMERTLRLD